jgi:hypothetical protein
VLGGRSQPRIPVRPSSLPKTVKPRSSTFRACGQPGLDDDVGPGTGVHRLPRFEVAGGHRGALPTRALASGGSRRAVAHASARCPWPLD